MLLIILQENVRARAWRPSIDLSTSDAFEEATTKFLRQLSDHGRAPWPALLKLSEKTRALEVQNSSLRAFSDYSVDYQPNLLVVLGTSSPEPAVYPHGDTLFLVRVDSVVLYLSLRATSSLDDKAGFNGHKATVHCPRPIEYERNMTSYIDMFSLGICRALLPPV